MVFSIKILNSLIVVFLLFIIGFKVINNLEYKNHLKEIDRIFVDGKPNKTNYIGYIEISEVSIKRGIVKGINNDVLANNDVGMFNGESIVLAGHSIKNVFGNLHYLEINDEIDLYLYNELIKYKVKNINIVDRTDFSFPKDDLILITCMPNPNQRLIIGAKKIYN